jgi:excisionase family DNA binding protein
VGPREFLYWTPEEFANELRVSVKSIYRWAAEDATMPQLRLGTGKGGTLRFPRERVMRWLRQREGATAVITRGIFTSVKDRARKLLRYIRQYNQAPKPLKWRYSRRQPSNHYHFARYGPLVGFPGANRSSWTGGDRIVLRWGLPGCPVVRRRELWHGRFHRRRLD